MQRWNHEGREQHEGQALQNKPLDAVFEFGDIEVDEKPHSDFSQLHVGQ